MNGDLIAFGLVALALGIGALVGARHLFPRLNVPTDTESSIQLLVAMIAGILLLIGLGLVLIGLFG